ncbi:MAG: hypothetical protein HYV19_09870 [Gemmatimonadetes bacterium]|nr:hypothetical protein [Gemmatimonadota bacterium]
MTPELPDRVHIFAALPLIAALAVACSGLTNTDDAGGACRQTYEFSNSGCLEVRGQVVSTIGRGLGGMLVSVRPLRTSWGFPTTFATTDTSGRFRIRLTRMVGSPPSAGTPDTLSCYVSASQPVAPGSGAAVVRDSVLTVVTVAPVGATPVPAEVRITLPVTATAQR